MSREMAHKVIVPQKKIMSQSFLNSGTLVILFTQVLFFFVYCCVLLSVVGFCCVLLCVVVCQRGAEQGTTILTTWLCKPFDGCIIKFQDTFIKKDFPFFEPFPAHLQSKFEKSANMTKKKIFDKKSKKVSKNNTEFHADFESVEKVLKKCTQKS